ncbi:longitudinals lacking protein, isoforms N/O/W/X/Y-like [Schistocerca nitens]|uniref:longitudinals lacking protein, isoforms N/O/W/X/Y-like n=1 Tax=Schistocerca nitens TaxID=7011 RepID=UPI002117BD28|nr:longitudinals lacking protein, isoforms N/O/W/X/Y-like [Schistocerca nitens]
MDVHLRWNNHQATLMSVFDALLENEKLTDCTISAEGHHLRAHKIILSACSPYFEELFSENYEKHPIIILHDVKYAAIKALLDFMYRGKVNVPQEELSGVLKLSESLQVRGLSGSGCVDDINMQKGSERNELPENNPSQPVSVSCSSLSQNERERNVQSFRRCCPSGSSQDGGSESIQKHRKIIKHSSFDQGMGQNAFKEVITPDFDSVHQLPPQREVMATANNSSGGSVYSPVQVQKTSSSSAHITVSSSSSSSSYIQIPYQSDCSELQSSRGEMAVAVNEQFLIPEAVLPEKKSANLSAYQQEVSLEIKSEVLESHMEIVEDLTLDDDDDDDDNYRSANDYHDDCNSAEVDIGEVRRSNEDLTYEENFCTQEMKNLHSPSGSDYLNNVTLTTSQTASRKRFSCHTCSKSYRYPQGLHRHLKFECGKEPQVQCPRCSYRCFRSDTLKKHMTTRRCLRQENYAIFVGDE